MKLTIHDKKMLLILGGILIMALCYVFVYRPQLEEAGNIETESAQLQKRLNELLKLAKDEDSYVQETSSMEEQIEAWCASFPALVRPEDGIILAMNMENSLGITVSNVSIGSSELLWQSEQSDSDSSASEQTVSEQLNGTTQAQLDQLEESEDTGTEADTSNAAAETGSSEENPALYRIQDTFQFDCTYENLKEMIDYLSSRENRMTIDNVTVSFDSSTGNLTGTMTINLYFLTGMNKAYTQPDAGFVSYGTENIFGTISSEEETETTSDRTDNEAEEVAETGETVTTSAVE